MQQQFAKHRIAIVVAYRRLRIRTEEKDRPGNRRGIPAEPSAGIVRPVIGLAHRFHDFLLFNRAQREILRAVDEIRNRRS
ncbi:hypothetical protein SDC9_209036 [bioreactor metagenome]|uniref:Uncharacterized protein n=1 Tax=bioreactor metagenome TaxID=1076179 RepID=A0A645JCB3_9ZZZZ